MSDQETVRKVYPDAVESWIPWDETEPFSIAQIYPSRLGDDPVIGEGGTMDEAWSDAATRLSTER